MIKRNIYKHLLAWKEQKKHKPLIMRGARQTGKTYIVEQLGATFANFVSINCEANNAVKKIFAQDLSPSRIVRNLSLFIGQKIIPGETLLFFDEAQEIPEVLQVLRYFYEKMPELHVIVAGSLLDFVLENIGVAVGRVSFLYLYPVSFLEFLQMTDPLLAENMLQYRIGVPLSEVMHHKLLRCLAVYFAVGGMPEAMQCWIDTQDLVACNKIHHELIDSYRQDFQKYAKKNQIKYIDLLFDRIPLYQGKPFKYSNVSQDYRKRELMPALELLIKAQVVFMVKCSAGNGVPLGAEINPDKFKAIFLDVALAQTVLGLNTKEWILDADETFVNQGAVVEAFVGQELLAYSDPSVKANLYYWQREMRGSNAEVDYLIEKNVVIPVEVKSGATGTLRSLQAFLQSRNAPYGIRFSAYNYSRHDRIYSYPLYAIAKSIGTR